MNSTMAGKIFHEWNGTTLIITSDSGTSSCDLKGEPGNMGIRGPQGPASLESVMLENKADEWPGNNGGYWTVRARLRKDNGEMLTGYTSCANSPIANGIPMYGPNKQLSTETPTADKHCVNKSYVDKLIAELQAQIAELKGE